MLRPPKKGPRLGLSIPASPSQRPVSNNAAPPVPEHSVALPPLAMQPRQLPKLSLATPMGSTQTPQENQQARRRGPPLTLTGVQVSSNSDDSAHSRTNSFGTSNNGSISTSSDMSSVLNFESIIRGGHEPGSADSSGQSSGEPMARENSMQGLDVDLEKLSLERGRALDVQDLDDNGWKAAKREGKILELGSLGEGSGGAVTKCKLEGGKTVFALKVCLQTCPVMTSC